VRGQINRAIAPEHVTLLSPLFTPVGLLAAERKFQHYLWMPEGLKNARGSFSRMTAKVLHSQIGSNILTCVDDIIVKSTKQENHIADLQETFANFRQAGLKLNPEKCVFRVKKGKFLGCLVSMKGIEANPSKIESILRMEPPNLKKGAQRLAGRLASLNRFISRSAKRNLPFFEILKSAEVFQWGLVSVFWVRPHTRGCPSRCFRSRMVSPTVAKWFVPDARGTMDSVYRFGPLRDA
jgi:hypothetical protein